MDKTRLLAILLIAGGILAVIYGDLTYTKERHDVKLGPLEIQVQERKSVNLPLWVGVPAIVAGAALLATRRSRG